MDLREILRSSLSLLQSEPKLFVPRLIMSILYTVFTLYSVGLTADYLEVSDPASVSSFIWKIAALFTLLPALYFLDILSYAMYPSMVADSRLGRPLSLKAALRDGLRAWRIVVALGLSIFAFLILLVTVAAPLQYLTYTTGNIGYTILAAVLGLALILGFSVIVFFVVPSAIYEGRGVMESFKESVRMGLRHKGDLLKLNLLFTLLVATTMLAAFWAELEDSMTLAAALLFLVVRLAKTVVYTYVSVVNPLAYLSVRVKKAAPE